MELAPIVAILRAEFSDLQALYLFGSQKRGDTDAASDVDLALLLPRALAAQRRFDAQEKIAASLARDVDLIDLRAATTVMQAQVLRDGELLDDRAPTERAVFEMLVLANYARLNEERAGILRDIAERGSVYGR